MARSNGRNGVVLVLALWAIVLLSALAMATSTTFREFGAVISASQDRMRAEALLSAGLAAAASVFEEVGDQQPLAAREFDLRLATGSAHVRLSDETGRVNINKASAKVLSALLQYVGADNADALAASISAWRLRDQASAGSQAATPPQAAVPPAIGPTTDPAAQPSSQAQSGPSAPPSFTDVRQLLQIPGMSEDILTAIAPLITVFGDDKINALAATPEVLAAMPGMTHAQIDALLEARLHSPVSSDGIAAILASAADYIESKERPIALVEISARLADGYAESVRATITVVPNDKLSYRVLAWSPSSTPPLRDAFLSNGDR
jgi:general secretion pathway protein K